MITFAVNAGLLIWVATSYRKLKHDVLLALLFGTAKAGLIVAFSSGAATQVGWFAIAVSALISGLVSFLVCWAFMALFSRIDRLELEQRQALAAGGTRSKSAPVAEWIGVVITGLVCLFF